MPSLSRCVTRAAHYVTAREKKMAEKNYDKDPRTTPREVKCEL